MITYLPASQRSAQPWKNGGGITHEVCAFPAGTEFDWRVSMAEVSEPGPFSHFTGIDRHLSVLSGRLQLDFIDYSVTLDTGEGLAFAGDIACFATPMEGPVMDLNVMIRRDRCQSFVRNIFAPTHITESTAILIACQPMRGAGFDLHGLDALLLHDETGREIELKNPAILIEISGDI